ncbi:MAG: alpha/beta hydrolase [Pseudomonadota bacterium]
MTFADTASDIKQLPGLTTEIMQTLQPKTRFAEALLLTQRWVLGGMVRRSSRKLVKLIDDGKIDEAKDLAGKMRPKVYGDEAKILAQSVAAEAMQEFPLDGAPGVESHPDSLYWFRPRKEKRDELVFYVHGGGFLLDASPAVMRMVSRMAVEAGASLARPAYRLAPEHPCPAAVDDVLAAYTWICEHQKDRPVVLVAESCGCNIGLVALQQAAKRGLPLPKGILLFSPWIDLAMRSWSMIAQSIVDRSPFGLDLVAFAAQLYLQGRSPLDEWANPLVGSFDGFPPTLIHTSKSDMFHDDAMALARQMSKSDARVHVRTWLDQEHVWEQFHSPDAEASMKKAAKFARACFDETA